LSTKGLHVQTMPVHIPCTVYKDDVTLDLGSYYIYGRVLRWKAADSDWSGCSPHPNWNGIRTSCCGLLWAGNCFEAMWQTACKSKIINACATTIC
jgi:hypothetical protein